MGKYIHKETARRIIDSPRNKEQMLMVLNSIPEPPEFEKIKQEVCDNICRWPYIWDEEKDGPLADSETCKKCPMARL